VRGRITGIVLLCCFVAPIVVTFNLLQYHKKQVRKEVKHLIIAGINREELVLLRFTEEESHARLKWKHSKEFEYNQQMYDIVETEVKGDTTYYWCWSDNKETRLNQHLDELLTYALRKDPNQRKNQRQLVKFYKSLYSNQLHHFRLHSFQTEQTTANYRFTCYVVSYPPPVPPPELG